MSTNLASKDFTIPTILNVDGGDEKTFFCTAADSSGVNKVAISAGAINNKICATLLWTVSDGDSIWIVITFDSDGLVVLSCDSGHGASIPNNTSILAYKLLATISISSGITSVIPLGWNFTDAKACGSDGSGNIVVNWN